MKLTIATEEEKEKIFQLIKSNNEESQKYGIDLARSFKLENKDILFAIMSRKPEIKMDSSNYGFICEFSFLNLKFKFKVYYYSTNTIERYVKLFVRVKFNHSLSSREIEIIYFKEQVKYNMFNNSEMFVNMQINGLIKLIKTI